MRSAYHPPSSVEILARVRIKLQKATSETFFDAYDMASVLIVLSDTRRFVNEAICEAVPPPGHGGLFSGWTACFFCGRKGTVDHPVNHKEDCFVVRAEEFLKATAEA